MIRFAVFTDFHYDFIHDGDKRLEELIAGLKQEEIDFVVSLGDLCRPFPSNQSIVERLRNSGIPIYFAVGNHDIELSEVKELTEFLGIENDWYSFVKDDVKFIILNSCYESRDGVFYPHSKELFNRETDIYPLIPDIQIEWLKEELRDEQMKYVVVSHHSLVNHFRDRGIVNRMEIRRVLETRNVILCMNGHDHGDQYWEINGIPYLTINSASYIWHGTKEIYSYAPEIHEKYPWLRYIIMYDRPLYAVVTIDEETLKVKGMKGGYQTISPKEAGLGNKWNGIRLAAGISDYECQLS